MWQQYRRAVERKRKLRQSKHKMEQNMLNDYKHGQFHPGGMVVKFPLFACRSGARI
jgi:hypothetical protein